MTPAPKRLTPLEASVLERLRTKGRLSHQNTFGADLAALRRLVRKKLAIVVFDRGAEFGHFQPVAEQPEQAPADTVPKEPLEGPKL